LHLNGLLSINIFYVFIAGRINHLNCEIFRIAITIQNYRSSMKNKMIKRSHLSEKKCREIIQLFSEDITATQIASITGVSRVTINNYLKLIRTEIARYCEERNPRYFHTLANGSLQGSNGHKKNSESNDTPIAGELLPAHYGFFRQEGSIFADGLQQLDRNDIIVLQQAKLSGAAGNGIEGEWTKYHAIADFDSWKLYRVGTGHLVNGSSHADDIAIFWRHTKNRLMKFRGLNKNTLYLHVKECEFRYNNRNNDINGLLLSIMYHNPLYLPGSLTSVKI
jgi:transposase